jgi:hypothetical protein
VREVLACVLFQTDKGICSITPKHFLLVGLLFSPKLAVVDHCQHVYRGLGTGCRQTTMVKAGAKPAKGTYRHAYDAFNVKRINSLKYTGRVLQRTLANPGGGAGI